MNAEVSSVDDSLSRVNINKSDFETTTISHASTEILKDDRRSIPDLVKKCWPLVEFDDA